ncbi:MULTISPECIES: hypothetical protein [Corynebacterium]|nr:MULTISPECIES: hypothetical protein [Corynebacterium]
MATTPETVPGSFDEPATALNRTLLMVLLRVGVEKRVSVRRTQSRQ